LKRALLLFLSDCLFQWKRERCFPGKREKMINNPMIADVNRDYFAGFNRFQLGREMLSALRFQKMRAIFPQVKDSGAVTVPLP
jgi:hypothetical protein